MFIQKLFMTKNQELRSGWKIISAVLLFIMLNILGSMLVVNLVPHDMAMQIGPMVGPFAMIVAVWVALKLLDERKFSDIGLISPRRGGRDFVVGLLFGAVAMSLIFAILYAAGQIDLSNSLSNPVFSRYLWIQLILYIIVGFAEEIFFRGYVMNALQQMGKVRLTVIISAVIFSIAHANNPNSLHDLGLVNIFLVGVLFAYMFIKTGNIWLSIGFHITWNYFQGNVFGFPVSGTAPHGIYHIQSLGSSLWTGGTFGAEGGLLATIILVAGFLFVWWYPARLSAKARVFT